MYAERPSIAVVGTGIAGMAAAWLLSRRYEVTVYEAATRIGGHTNTVTVDDPRGPIGVDTGFIVHNRGNYPHLSALFDTLGVATQPTDMSFAVSVGDGTLEYSGTSLNGLFGQRRNLARPAFHRMLFDIARFNRVGRRLAREGGDPREPLGAFLERNGLGRAFREHYLLPMAAAIWSCPTRQMLEFPALSLARFFDNHGLLEINDRPQWRTVCGGSGRYVREITAPYAQRIRTATPVSAIVPVDGGVRVLDRRGGDRRFSQVVVAAHADQALAMIAAGDGARREALSRFRYQGNRAVLHTDARLMPVRRRVWSAWNYLALPGDDACAGVSVTYWMNRLQRLDARRQYFVSLNPLRDPEPGSVVAEFDYDHPVFDVEAVRAQALLPAEQGRDGIWLAGSYFGNGFHEDALRSAVDVATRLGCAPPWRGRAPQHDAHRAPSAAAELAARVALDPAR